MTPAPSETQAAAAAGQPVEEAEARARTLSESSAGTGTTAAAPAKWVDDARAPACMRCHTAFNTFKRRHHCRKCGEVVCSTCSPNRMLLPEVHATREQRICTACEAGQQGSSAGGAAANAEPSNVELVPSGDEARREF